MQSPLKMISLVKRLVSVLRQGGMLRLESMRSLASGIRQTGRSPVALLHVAAARTPDQAAIIDDLGTVSWKSLENRVLAIRSGLARECGVTQAQTVAVLCRNHRGFVEASWAVISLGADILLLNTDFPGEQLKQVLEREAVSVIINDPEFTQALDNAGYTGMRISAYPGEREQLTDLDRLALPHHEAPGRPGKKSKITLLTSGTSGTPKGAPRSPNPLALLGPIVTMLEEIPFQVGKKVSVSPPLFHGFGFAFLLVTTAISGTMILRRKFDAAQCLSDLEKFDVSIVVGVPVMLQRLADEADRAPKQLKIEALLSAAAPLTPALAERLQGVFGHVLYNLYGSSEVGFAAIAIPADLLAAPGCVGRAPEGTTISVLDNAGRAVKDGEIGRIFLRSGMVFKGYTGGGDKERIRGFVSTGDMGRVDSGGRLFVEGRDDDMILSGGENVYPQEIEDVLAHHPDVVDVAVIGVHDDEFGQRLRAFIVVREGAILKEDCLKEFLRQKVARYKMPRDFVWIEELPRNPSGKVMKRRLAEEPASASQEVAMT